MRKSEPLLKPKETIAPAKMQLVYTNDNLPKGLNVNSVLTEKEVSIHFNWKRRTLSNYRSYYQQSGGNIKVGPKWIRYGVKTIRYVVKDILRASAGLLWTEPYPEFYNPVNPKPKKN